MVKPRTPRLLVVEDERNVGTTLVERLKKEGFEVNWATTVQESKLQIQSLKFDLVLLDVGLPDGSGFSVAENLKKTSPATAIIFLTAYGTPEERIRGLEMGAEDYIVKPFHLKELLLRVQNGLKRASHLSDSQISDLKIGKAKINFSKYLAEVGQTEHTLTHKECALLKLLVDRKGAVVSRDEILNYVWSESEFPTPRTVDNFILRLRKLIEIDPEHPKHIKSVRGVGYQLDLVEL